jgi:hypothetical protein
MKDRRTRPRPTSPRPGRPQALPSSREHHLAASDGPLRYPAKDTARGSMRVGPDGQHAVATSLALQLYRVIEGEKTPRWGGRLLPALGANDRHRTKRSRLQRNTVSDLRSCTLVHRFQRMSTARSPGFTSAWCQPGCIYPPSITRQLQLAHTASRRRSQSVTSQAAPRSNRVALNTRWSKPLTRAGNPLDLAQP